MTPRSCSPLRDPNTGRAIQAYPFSQLERPYWGAVHAWGWFLVVDTHWRGNPPVGL